MTPRLRHTFCLTRVTRIFQKSVFTETTPGRPGGRPRRVFCCADAARPRAAYSFASRKGDKSCRFRRVKAEIQPAVRAGRATGRRSCCKTLAADAEAIARKAIDLAKGGDLAALRMCMDRLAPARKTEPVVLDLPPLGTAADTVDAAATIVAAAAAGELTPSEAADLANVIDIYVRALATRGFEERLAKLEGSPARGTMPADAAA